MAKDLRSFIAQLREQYPGEMAVIERTVRPSEFEVSAVVDHFERLNRFPLVLFNRVTTLKGDIWDGQLVSSADPGTFRRAAITLGLDVNAVNSQEVVNTIARGIQRPIPPEVIDPKEAPVRAQVCTGSAIDLRDLPLMMHYKLDTRPGWCTPIIAAAHPETRRYNLSYHRVLFKTPQTVTVSITSAHLREYHTRAEELGKPLPVALVLGHHPGFYVGAGMRPDLTVDEYAVVGGVLGEPLRLTPSESFGERLLVPADAEIIIEGQVLPHRRELEGPFSEWSHYYGPQTRKPLIEVTAVTMRERPIFQALRASFHIIEDLAHSAGIYAQLKSRFPRIKAACSLFHSWAIISMEKQREGEPLRVAAAALAYGPHVKHVVIVDDDVDPFNLRQVFWAIGVRVQPSLQLQVLKEIQANMLDPSTITPGKGSVMIIDATIPKDRPYEELVSVPKELSERVSAEFASYVSPEELERIPRGDPWTL